MVTNREEVNCGSCVFFMAPMRVCRRYPPRPIMLGVKQGIAQLSQQQEPLILSYFPNMMPNGWCGEYTAIPKQEENN